MADISPTIVELEPQQAVTVHGEVAIADMPQFFHDAFVSSYEAAAAAGVDIVGPPFGFYPEMPTDTVVIEAGFPVSAPVSVAGKTHPMVLPGGRAIELIHVGPFETMENTYTGLQAWMQEHGIQPASGMWEVYLTDPQVEPDQAKWQTKIVWPIL